MARIDSLCADQLGEFRLLATPCWLKLCRFDSKLRDATSLVSGMYLARSHFEELLDKSRGHAVANSSPVTTFRVTSTTACLWTWLGAAGIGSRGAATEQIKQLVRESLVTRHAVMLGIEIDTNRRRVPR